MTTTSGTSEWQRAPDRRPRAVLIDVFETMLRVDALRPRFADVGRAEQECELFFVRAVRDGMALTLAGAAQPFTDVARAALRTTTGHTLSDEAVEYVLEGFRELPPHADVEPALMALARARIPAYAFTQGTGAVARDALDRAGLRTYLRDVLSTEQIRSFKPPPQVYHWACRQVGFSPDRVALVAAHSWDVHGAVRSGLVAGLATRLEGAVPDIVERPHVTADSLDAVVDRLIGLPG